MVKIRPSLLGLCALAVLGAACSSQPAPNTDHSPQEAAGQTLFTRHCAACHSLNADTVIVGPPLAGIANQAQQRVAGMDASAYLHQSIMEPSAYLVEGFSDLMPPTLGQVLTPEEVDALVAYMLTLQ